MHRQSETRAGNHQRHTRARSVSLPTQANHTARGARKQPPNKGAPVAMHLVSCWISEVCYKEMRSFGMLEQAGNRAENHQRDTHQTPAQQRRPTALHERQTAIPPTRPLYKHLTNTSHSYHAALYATKAAGTDKGAGLPPRARQGQAQGTYNWNHCDTPAPMMKPRRGSAGALCRNKKS